MKTSTRWVLAFCTVAIAFGLAWNLTPHASMEGKEKSKPNNPIPSVAPDTSYRNPGARHKVAVSDSALADSLRKSGGRLVADYGSYKLLEVDSAAAAALNSNSNAQLADENNLVLLNSGAIDTSTAEAQSMRQSASSGSGKQMRLIQFAGPIQPEWYAALLRTGVKIVTYIPNNAYLVYGAQSNLDAVRSLAASSRAVQWDGPYTSVHRLSRSINSQTIAKDGPTKEVSKESKQGVLNRTAAKTSQLYAIQLVADKENTNTLSLINQLKTAPIVKQGAVLDYLNVIVALPQDAVVSQIAERGDVVSISTWSMPHRMDERQDQIIAGNLTGSGPTAGDYLAYLAGKGFTTTTTSFGVNISDSGVDNGSTTPNHFALYALGNPTAPANSRMVYARVVGTPTGPGSTTQGCDGHGNLNTHIIGGYVPTGTVGGVNFGAAPHADASGFRYDLGVFPYVKIGSSVIFDNSGAPTGDFTSPDYTTLESMAYNDTMRISSNSWGASDNSYTIDSQEYDALVRDAQPAGSSFPTAGNQEYVILFAAGNDGSGSNTVGEPGTAKNIITVGASEGVQSLGGTDFCGIGDPGADSANDIIGFSSRGPTADGRKKPDIVAPGTHITGGVGQASIASPTGSGTGSAIACFDATGVCAGVGSDFFPTGQQWYTSSDGTSHSTPAMSAYAAIIRQHFINQALTPPTPAMTKALMLNTARYMNGAGANDSLFSNSQGMGEANFNSFFDLFTTGSIRRDQVAADKFTASGQQRIFTGSINTNTKPFRVTLAWTDPPGPTSGNAYVNNLDLEVTVGGNTYKGNVFSGADSATGGAADTRNNVESVFVPAGITGNFVVRVKGTNIAGNGVPGDADPLDQDFALVVSNATAGNIPVLEGGTATVTAESCAPANTAIDPGETVTVNLPLSNVGTANTSSLVATLQATGGVSSPSGPQNYGVVVAGGSAVTRPFTFTATTTCGQDLAITLQLQDGANNLGTVTFTMRTGTLGAPSSALYSTGNIATAIPDVSSVEIPIVIAATGAVADVNARVRLNHTFDHDLVIELVAPDGTTVVLAQNRDTALGGGDNYGTGSNDCAGTPTIFDDAAATAIGSGLPPFAGTFRPETPLSDLNGHTITGTWKLRVTDIEAQDVGTVGCVTLDISRQPFVCCGVVGTPIIGSGGAATITAESIAPANNAPDPGETITANFPLINTGDGNTTNLVATLQNSGGVTPVTTSANYGVVVASGPAVSRPFTFVTSGSCGGTITATLQLQDGAINLGTVAYTFQLGTTSTASSTFTNATAIVIPATGTGATTGAPATPYPSNVTVAGIVNPVTKVTVTLKNISHTFPDDVDVLLVGPTGRKFIVISDAGDTNDWVGATITLDDTAASSLQDVNNNGTGTYKPGNFGTVQDPFPAPAPAGPYLSPAPGGADTFATAFNGLDPNGTWSLYVVDDAGTDTGTFAGGWDLNITTSQTVCNTQTCSVTCPANISVPESSPGSGSAVVNYPGATPTGACGVLGYDVPSGSTFPLGATTVHVTGANAASCSFTVTVTGGGSVTTAGQLIISEFRVRGPSGANDEFIDLYNTTGASLTTQAADASTGLAVAASDGTARCVVPNGTVIPAGGHFLCSNSVAYSISGYPSGNGTTATGNLTYTTDIPDNAGIALFNNSTGGGSFSVANRLDAVGSTSEANTTYKEGTGYPALTPFSIDYSFVRKLPGGCTGSGTSPSGNCNSVALIQTTPGPTSTQPQDTGDNATDFIFVDTNGTSAGAGQRLGAPGPQNLSGPGVLDGAASISLFDSCVAANADPNFVRDLTSVPANNSTFGTVDLRRTFTNNTGGNITRLRFRIVDITTFPSISGVADLRPFTSSTISVTGDKPPCGGSTASYSVQGTTLEQPPSQPNGSGYNGSLSVGTITSGTPLAAGASVDFRMLAGVQQTGAARMCVVAETLPASASQVSCFMINDTNPAACSGITCPANVTQGNDPNQCGAVVTYPAPTPSGTCGTITCSPASGSFFPVGSTTVNCTSTAGPACSFTVTVNDTQPPSITCPANVVVPAQPGFDGATVNYPAPTVTDNCPGAPAPVCIPASGSFFPTGVTTVTCSVGGTSCVSKTITHSSSQAITPLNSVSCNDGFGHTDNHYWRAFSLPSFSITGTFHVSSVDVGIEDATAGSGTAPSHQTRSVKRNSARSASGSRGNRKGGSAPEGTATQPITVLLHTNTGGAFPGGTLNFLNSTTVNVADQSGTILNVPITADVPAGSELVVEIFTPDGTTTGNLFFIGSNSAAETGPSYLSAPDCGINDPTTTTAIGFPDMHIVMNVNGCEDTTGGASASCNFTVSVKPPRYWSTVGSAGTTDEDSTALVSHEDFAATLKSGLTGTATVRYNITAVQGISAYCPATQSIVYVRFRNSDNAGTHAQVKFDIHRTSILAGGNDTIFSFNSNGVGAGNVFTSASLSPNIDFDFSNYIYWIEATVFRDQAGQFADLGSIEIFETDGTPCP